VDAEPVRDVAPYRVVERGEVHPADPDRQHAAPDVDSDEVRHDLLAEVCREAYDAARPGVRVGLPGLEALFDEACARYGLTARDQRRIARLDAFLRQSFGISFGNRVYAQIRRYVPVYSSRGLPAVEALDQVLSRKVLRKLGAANPVLVRSRSGELLALLAELFGEGGAPLCEAAVRRISDNG
jgi:hypothetical protein